LVGQFTINFGREGINPLKDYLGLDFNPEIRILPKASSSPIRLMDPLENSIRLENWQLEKIWQKPKGYFGKTQALPNRRPKFPGQDVG